MAELLSPPIWRWVGSKFCFSLISRASKFSYFSRVIQANPSETGGPDYKRSTLIFPVYFYNGFMSSPGGGIALKTLALRCYISHRSFRLNQQRYAHIWHQREANSAYSGAPRNVLCGRWHVKFHQISYEAASGLSAK
jgi:hypothetical protein